MAEVFDSEFYNRFVSFVKAGDYQHYGKAEKYGLYRFENPTNRSFPPIIELLGKRPEYLAGIETDLGRFQTIDAGGSLSAILLDDEYYGLLEKGIVEIEGLLVLSLEYLPVFKIHAWANLTDDKTAGKAVHGDEIKKHRRDVLRLFPVCTRNPYRTSGIHHCRSGALRRKSSLGRQHDAQPRAFCLGERYGRLDQ